MVQKIGSVFRPQLFIYLIRALIPSWNFFDHVNYQFGLEFKVSGSEKWENVTFQRKNDLFGLLINPEINMDMAQVNIIEHFAYDIQDLIFKDPKIRFKDVQRLTSFKLLKSVLRIQLKNYQIAHSTIQFKIVATNLNEIKDIYISDWVDVGESL